MLAVNLRRAARRMRTSFCIIDARGSTDVQALRGAMYGRRWGRRESAQLGEVNICAFVNDAGTTAL